MGYAASMGERGVAAITSLGSSASLTVPRDGRIRCFNLIAGTQGAMLRQYLLVLAAGTLGEAILAPCLRVLLTASL